MASFAAQLRDRFLGLVDRVAGCGRAGDSPDHDGAAAAAKKDAAAAKLPAVQEHVEIRSREVSGGSKAGVN